MLMMMKGDECQQWNLLADKHIGGGRHRYASTLSDCQKQCVDDYRSTGIDWNADNARHLGCWIHGPWSGDNPMEDGGSKFDHYRLYRTYC